VTLGRGASPRTHEERTNHMGKSIPIRHGRVLEGHRANPRQLTQAKGAGYRKIRRNKEKRSVKRRISGNPSEEGKKAEAFPNDQGKRGPVKAIPRKNQRVEGR